MKQCKSCLEIKPLDKFETGRNKSGSTYYRNECKLCRGRKHNQYSHWQAIVRKYDLTQEEWEELALQQNYRCAICRIKFSDLKQRPHVDHNHETNIVRQLLCPGCNKGLGHFRDSPELLERAAQYLRKHS